MRFARARAFLPHGFGPLAPRTLAVFGFCEGGVVLDYHLDCCSRARARKTPISFRGFRVTNSLRERSRRALRSDSRCERRSFSFYHLRSKLRARQIYLRVRDSAAIVLLLRSSAVFGRPSIGRRFSKNTFSDKGFPSSFGKQGRHELPK